MGTKKKTVEKGNDASSTPGDGRAIAKAKEILIAYLTEEQTRIPKDHEDWMALENNKESILRLNDIVTLKGMLESLAEIIERVSTEKLLEETQK